MARAVKKNTSLMIGPGQRERVLQQYTKGRKSGMMLQWFSRGTLDELATLGEVYWHSTFDRSGSQGACTVV